MGSVGGGWGLIKEERHIYYRDRGVVKIRGYWPTLPGQQVPQPLPVRVHCLLVNTVLPGGKACAEDVLQRHSFS